MNNLDCGYRSFTTKKIIQHETITLLSSKSTPVKEHLLDMPEGRSLIRKFVRVLSSVTKTMESLRRKLWNLGRKGFKHVRRKIKSFRVVPRGNAVNKNTSHEMPSSSSSLIPYLPMEKGAIDPSPPSYFVSGCNLSLSPGLKFEMFPPLSCLSLCCPVLCLPSGAHISAILGFLSDGILKT